MPFETNQKANVSNYGDNGPLNALAHHLSHRWSALQDHQKNSLLEAFRKYYGVAQFTQADLDKIMASSFRPMHREALLGPVLRSLVFPMPTPEELNSNDNNVKKRAEEAKKKAEEKLVEASDIVQLANATFGVKVELYTEATKDRDGTLPNQAEGLGNSLKLFYTPETGKWAYQRHLSQNSLELSHHNSQYKKDDAYPDSASLKAVIGAALQKNSRANLGQILDDEKMYSQMPFGIGKSGGSLRGFVELFFSLFAGIQVLVSKVKRVFNPGADLDPQEISENEEAPLFAEMVERVKEKKGAKIASGLNAAWRNDPARAWERLNLELDEPERVLSKLEKTLEMKVGEVERTPEGHLRKKRKELVEYAASIRDQLRAIDSAETPEERVRASGLSKIGTETLKILDELFSEENTVLRNLDENVSIETTEQVRTIKTRVERLEASWNELQEERRRAQKAESVEKEADEGMIKLAAAYPPAGLSPQHAQILQVLNQERSRLERRKDTARDDKEAAIKSMNEKMKNIAEI